MRMGTGAFPKVTTKSFLNILTGFLINCTRFFQLLLNVFLYQNKRKMIIISHNCYCSILGSNLSLQIPMSRFLKKEFMETPIIIID